MLQRVKVEWGVFYRSFLPPQTRVLTTNRFFFTLPPVFVPHARAESPLDNLSPVSGRCFFCACLHLFTRPPAAARKAFNFHAASRTEAGRVRLRSFGMLAGRLKQILDVRLSHLLETGGLTDFILFLPPASSTRKNARPTF